MMGVVSPGPVPVDLLRRFRRQARGRTPPATTPGHADGWGITYAEAGRAVHAGRSARDALDDPAYDEALATLAARQPSGVVLAHVRKASAGAVTVENAHPFASGKWAFCHNGTVWGFAPEGESDSRAMFAFLLREIGAGAHPVEALRRLAKDVEGRLRYSSLTCLLTDGATLWGMRKVGAYDDECVGNACDPAYYTLGVARIGDALVVSQEHEFLDAEGWTPLADGSVLQVDPDTGLRVGRL